MTKVTLLDCIEELPDNLDILIHLGNGTYTGPDGEAVDSIAILVENIMDGNNINASDMDTIEYLEIYGDVTEKTKKWVFDNWMAENSN
jgi:hypothetical protein